jgi:hypothetical protein
VTPRCGHVLNDACFTGSIGTGALEPSIANSYYLESLVTHMGGRAVTTLDADHQYLDRTARRLLFHIDHSTACILRSVYNCDNRASNI